MMYIFKKDHKSPRLITSQHVIQRSGNHNHDEDQWDGIVCEDALHQIIYWSIKYRFSYIHRAFVFRIGQKLSKRLGQSGLCYLEPKYTHNNG